MDTKRFITPCCACGGATSRKYAREHGGKCKLCATGSRAVRTPTREERILDAGYQAYAIEEGHYNEDAS